MYTEKDKLKVLFVSSSGKVFKLIPFIKSQHESLEAFVEEIDHYRIEGSGIISYIRAYKSLKRKIRNQNFDIIHAHWTYAGILCWPLIKKEKLVISFMGNDLQGFYSKKYSILTLKGLTNIILSQLLLFKVSGIIVKSRKMRHWIPAFFHHKTEEIPNGVNLNKFKALDQSMARKHLNLDLKQKYILFLGDTEDPNKNFALLRKAAIQLDKENVDYKIISPYPVDSSEVPYYLAAADVLAFASKIEGSPNIIKEALAMGCPIVSTDVGDVQERIEMISGCYISKYNEYDFSKKLTAALKFGNRIDANGQLEEISEVTIAKRIISFYEKCLITTESKKS